MRRPLLAAAAAALAWIGILTSYSQSAFVALCAAVGAGLILAFGRRLAVLLLAGAALVGLALVGHALGAPLGRRTASPRSARSSSATACGSSARTRSPASASGGSTDAAREQTKRGRAVRRAQHVMPLTVASELGIVGLVLVALAAGRARASRAGRRARCRPERLALGLGLLAIFVHSLFYAAFFEDPLTWGLAALLVACAAPGIIEEP